MDPPQTPFLVPPQASLTTDEQASLTIQLTEHTHLDDLNLYLSSARSSLSFVNIASLRLLNQMYLDPIKPKSLSWHASKVSRKSSICRSGRKTAPCFSDYSVISLKSPTHSHDIGEKHTAMI